MNEIGLIEKHFSSAFRRPRFFPKQNLIDSSRGGHSSIFECRGKIHIYNHPIFSTQIKHNCHLIDLTSQCNHQKSLVVRRVPASQSQLMRAIKSALLVIIEYSTMHTHGRNLWMQSKAMHILSKHNAHNHNLCAESNVKCLIAMHAMIEHYTLHTVAPVLQSQLMYW